MFQLSNFFWHLAASKQILGLQNSCFEFISSLKSFMFVKLFCSPPPHISISSPKKKKSLFTLKFGRAVVRVRLFTVMHQMLHFGALSHNKWVQIIYPCIEITTQEKYHLPEISFALIYNMNCARKNIRPNYDNWMAQCERVAISQSNWQWQCHTYLISFLWILIKYQMHAKKKKIYICAHRMCRPKAQNSINFYLV